MSSNLIRAYEIGKRLALIKISQEIEGSKSTDTEVEELTKKLDSLFEGPLRAGNTNDILDSSERSSSSTWGDKMELETNSNTGINV